MEVLPDVVAPGLDVVFCGLAGAESTTPRDHRYDTPGNSFWPSLHAAGFTPRRIAPHEERQVLRYGVGLTDLVGHWDPRWVEIDRLVALCERMEPEWVAFTSKAAAGEAARALGVRPLTAATRLGARSWSVGPAQVFVLPGVSGANQRRDYDGRPNRLAWWVDLAMLCGRR